MRRKRFAVFSVVAMLVLMLSGCPNGTAELISVTPNVIPAGANGVVLKLTGKNLTNAATVVWNGKQMGQLVTTFVDSAHLTAVVPSSFLTTAGKATVLAFQTGQNQTATQPLSITIAAVVPTLTGIAPAHAIIGDAPVTLTLTGTNYTASTVVNWNGTALTTTFVSATSVTAVLPTATFGTAGVQKLTVTNSGGTSQSINFTVVAKLAITTSALPGGSVGTVYSTTLQAAGGTAPYTWSITSGALPNGLTLHAASGLIDGVPVSATSTSFTVQVVDSTGSLARRRF